MDGSRGLQWSRGEWQRYVETKEKLFQLNFSDLAQGFSGVTGRYLSKPKRIFYWQMMGEGDGWRAVRSVLCPD